MRATAFLKTLTFRPKLNFGTGVAVKTSHRGSKGLMELETGIETTRGCQTFLTMAEIEMRRAERYRIFVSLLVLDLSILQEMLPGRTTELMERLVDLASARIRCTDSIASTDPCRVALLFPETPRQSAMLAAHRLTEMVRRVLSEETGRSVDAIIPVEIVSYPDAAGAKTLGKALQDLAQRSRN